MSEKAEWYGNPGKHYFYKVTEKDDGLYLRPVNAIVGGGYRVHPERKIIPQMVDAFKEDHPEREEPSNWESAYIEYVK